MDGTMIEAVRNPQVLSAAEDMNDLLEDMAEAGNYVRTVLSERYDYMVFMDRSHALHPRVPEYAFLGVSEPCPSGV